MPQQPLPEDTIIPDQKPRREGLNAVHAKKTDISLLTQPQMLFSQASYSKLH